MWFCNMLIATSRKDLFYRTMLLAGQGMCYKNKAKYRQTICYAYVQAGWVAKISCISPPSSSSFMVHGFVNRSCLSGVGVDVLSFAVL
jgi:hypothetical protein